MDKNKIVLDYLLTSEEVSKLYFQYSIAAKDSMQIQTSTVESAQRKGYIDGSRPRRLDYTFVWFKPLGFIPVVANAGGSPQNVAELDDVQSIIDWIEEQNDSHNFPNFGSNCVVDRIYCLNDTPQLVGVDTSSNPPLARYKFTLRIEFIDYSHAI